MLLRPWRCWDWGNGRREDLLKNESYFWRDIFEGRFLKKWKDGKIEEGQIESTILDYKPIIVLLRAKLS